MASAAVSVSEETNFDIRTASLENLLAMAGAVEAQIQQRVDAIEEERRKRWERIRAILHDAGLDPIASASKQRKRKRSA